MINVENLTKYYGDICAVDNVNFEIHKGEILGLLGPNGAGKTTTLRMLTGFLQPSSGNILVKNMDIKKNNLEIKKALGYLPESAPLYHEMLVFDYLNYVAGIREIPRDERLSRLKRLAELCGLEEVMHKPITELSKGYRQRVGLAHAMMSEPEILILDEPTSGLDPNQIVEIREIIKEIGKEKTIVLSTHILSEVEATCDRIIIINRGKIVADDSTDHLKRAAGGEKSLFLSLMGADFSTIKSQLLEIEGVEEVSLLEDIAGVLHLKASIAYKEDLRGKIYENIKQTDWVLLDFHQETRSLENVFRELTKEEEN